jgi:hypothetical protein
MSGERRNTGTARKYGIDEPRFKLENEKCIL